MSWILCETDIDLQKWNICGNAFLHNECIQTVQYELDLIARKEDARYYAYLDAGVPKIVFCLIYKSYCDMFKVHLGALADNAYMLIYQTKLRDLIVETGKDFYLPLEYITHETAQDFFVDGWADNSIPDILDTLGVEVVIGEKVITFRVI